LRILGFFYFRLTNFGDEISAILEVSDGERWKFKNSSLKGRETLQEVGELEYHKNHCISRKVPTIQNHEDYLVTTMKSKNPKNQSKIRFSHPNLEKVN
jgi:hypothetical protein